MSTNNMDIWCGVYECGILFTVEIGLHETVSALRQAVANILAVDVSVAMLSLYLARDASGEWLKLDANASKSLLEKGDIEYKKMLSSWNLCDVECFGPDFVTAGDIIYVLVVSAVAIRGVVFMPDLPPPTQLANILQRRLPFRVELNEKELAPQIFSDDGPDLKCVDLSTAINDFLPACGKTKEEGSAVPRIPRVGPIDPWRFVYDRMIQIPRKLCWGYGSRTLVVRPRDQFGKAIGGLRPDVVVLCLDLMVLRGVENRVCKNFDDAHEELIKTMPSWNKFFFGQLPYTLGYVANKEKLAIYTIDPNFHTYRVLQFDSVVEQKAEVIKVFYSLAFFFRLMKKLYSIQSGQPFLVPFVVDSNEQRDIELMDGCIRRSIGVDTVEDFERLTDVYATKRLNTDEGQPTSLQTVDKMVVKEEHGEIALDLNPIGCEERPLTSKEVREWLRCMLTALKHWHGSNYCHGDICWENMIRVQSKPRYWVLIDQHEPSLSWISPPLQA